MSTAGGRSERRAGLWPEPRPWPGRAWLEAARPACLAEPRSRAPSWGPPERRQPPGHTAAPSAARCRARRVAAPSAQEAAPSAAWPRRAPSAACRRAQGRHRAAAGHAWGAAECATGVAPSAAGGPRREPSPGRPAPSAQRHATPLPTPSPQTADATAGSRAIRPSRWRRKTRPYHMGEGQ
jgi:hypothetical protein